MRPTEIISKKKEGLELTEDELSFFLNAYTAGKIPDYQMAAWLMAVYFKGMTLHERATWTRLMWKSGSTFPRTSRKDFWVDKHSTGGVGDKTSLLLVPLVSSTAEKVLGKGKVKLPMVSGRGLGHTGGTLDKLDSVPGFTSSLDSQAALKLLEGEGFFMMGQTQEIAPADKKIYALRDSTATVDSISLIISSILSKKLAENLDGIVFDVKVGLGAFMRDLSSARELAAGLVSTISSQGVKATALITDMDQPLGTSIGNFVEVEECSDFFDGSPESRLKELVVELASEMLFLADAKVCNKENWKQACESELFSPRTKELFRKMFENQGGRWTEFESQRNRLPEKHHEFVLKAPKEGFLSSCDALKIAQLVHELGGGRNRIEDPIRPRVGVKLVASVGQALKKDQPICKMIFYEDKEVEKYCSQLASCFTVSKESPVIKPVLIEVVK